MNQPRSADASTLIQYVESCQSLGRYTFTRQDALTYLGVSETALKKAVARLVKKHRLFVPRRGFYVIVPHEYRDQMSPPPTWFIDPLMEYENARYYVGVLSSAALHGSAHQQPNEFQVVCDKPIREISTQRWRIKFLTKKRIARSPITQIKVPTGYIHVSTPEVTALDLVRYYYAAGYLSNVATILKELSEKLDSSKLLETAKLEAEMSTAQRLGYLLDHVGSADIALPLHSWLTKQNPPPVKLLPGGEDQLIVKNRKWNILVNDTIEEDD